MASSHETITRASVDDCVCTFTGTITAINRTSNTATVTASGETYSNVPFHYHCPSETTVDNGHKSFHKGQQALCLKIGAAVSIVAHNTYRVGCNTNKYVMVYISYGSTTKYATVINPITKETPDWDGITFPNTYGNIINYINAKFSSYSRVSKTGMSLTLREDFAYVEMKEDGIISDIESSAVRALSRKSTRACNTVGDIYCDAPPASCSRSMSYPTNLRNCAGQSYLTCDHEYHPCGPLAWTYNFDHAIRTADVFARGARESTDLTSPDRLVYSFDVTSAIGNGCIRVASIYDERTYIDYGSDICSTSIGSGRVTQEDLTIISPLKTFSVTEFGQKDPYPYEHELSGEYEEDAGGDGNSIFFTHSILDSEIVAQMYIWQFTRIDDGTKDRFIHGAIEFFSNGTGETSGNYFDMVANTSFEELVEETITVFEADVGRPLGTSDNMSLYVLTVD